MAKMFKQLWIIVCLLSFVTSAHSFSEKSGADLLLLFSGQDITNHLEYIEDKQGDLTFDQAFADQWSAMDPQQLTFGYTDSVVWFRLALTNHSNQKQQRLLVIDYPVLDYVDIYQSTDNQEWQLTKIGDKYPFHERLVEHRDFIVPISIAAQSTNYYVFRVQTSSSLQFPIAIWQERHFFENDQIHLLLMGIYYGIMLVMAIYNFFVFLLTRELNYFNYVGLVVCMALFLSSYQGYSFQYLWPEATQWNDRSISVFLGGVLLFGILFTRLFLQINRIAFVNIALTLYSVPVVMVLLFSQLVSYHIQIQVIIAVAVACLFSAIVVGVLRWVQGYVTARYYTIAWLVVMIGGIVLALNKFNFIERNYFTEYAVQFGSGIEVILLSFALADRLNREKRKRYQAQLAALANERIAREAQQQTLDMQKEANEMLEQRVHERTLELERLNQRLELMTITDALTGVHNRRYFDQALKTEIARALREREEVSVLIVDIDFFKAINDTYGHQAGDEVLKAIASAMSKVVTRTADLLARFGGEEFVIILPNTSNDGALHVAQSICQAVAELKFDEIAKGIKMTVSIGVYSATPTISNHHEDWVRFADKALYQAKKNGRNQVVVYSGA